MCPHCGDELRVSLKHARSPSLIRSSRYVVVSKVAEDGVVSQQASRLHLTPARLLRQRPDASVIIDSAERTSRVCSSVALRHWRAERRTCATCVKGFAGTGSTGWRMRSLSRRELVPSRTAGRYRFSCDELDTRNKHYRVKSQHHRYSLNVDWSHEPICNTRIPGAANEELQKDLQQAVTAGRV